MQSSIPQSTPLSILLGMATGWCGVWEAGHWIGICSPSNISWVGLGSGQQEPDPVWSLGMSMEPGGAPGEPEAVQNLPWSICSLAKPWQVRFAPG